MDHPGLREDKSEKRQSIEGLAKLPAPLPAAFWIVASEMVLEGLRRRRSQLSGL
jgi:hypothetical protein